MLIEDIFLLLYDNKAFISVWVIGFFKNIKPLELDISSANFGKDEPDINTIFGIIFILYDLIKSFKICNICNAFESGKL